MEEEKKIYYISLSNRTISDIDTPEKEFTVYAKPSEMVKFERLIQSNKENDFIFAAKTMPFKPFAEHEADEMSEETRENYMEAYHFLYEHGTEETREKVKEIGYDI